MRLPFAVRGARQWLGTEIPALPFARGLLSAACSVRLVPMAVKLHRCSVKWAKFDAHPCWKVQKALDEQGVDYEVVAGPLRSGKRDELERLSGQRKYPVIEFEDG